jgi:uncharacterized membrane protein YjjP (DUF1212 family)
LASRFGERARERTRLLLRRTAALPHLLPHNGQHTTETDAPVPAEDSGHGPGPMVPDDARVLQVLDLAIRVGEVLLSSGEGVAETTAIMLRVADSSGLPSCDVDITFTSITISCHRGMVALPVTTMRLVRYRSLDLTRLAEAERLIQQLERGRCDLTEAAAELDRITGAKHPYPRWVATAAWAAMAASVALLLGGGWGAASVAFVATAAMDRAGRLLNRYGLPIFFQQLVGAFLATGITALVMFTGILPSTRPSLVVAAALTVLLSGLSVVGAARDGIDGFFLTAAGRAAEISMFSAALLAGVVLALKGAVHFNVELAVAGPLPISSGSALLQVSAAGMTAGCFALAGYSPVRHLPAAAATGAAGWAIHQLMQQLGLGPVVSTGIAAVVLGSGAGLLRRFTGVPALVISLAGITPLLPGLTAYQGFYQLAVTGVTDGLVTVMLALAIGGALAGGVSLGEWVTSRLLLPRDDRLGAAALGSLGK